MTARKIERTVEILGIDKQHMLVRDQLTECVVGLPFVDIEAIHSAEPRVGNIVAVTIPLALAAEKGIA